MKILTLLLLIIVYNSCFSQIDSKSIICICKIKADSILHQKKIYSEKNIYINKSKSLVTFLKSDSISSNSFQINVYNEDSVNKYLSNNYGYSAVALIYTMRFNNFIGEAKIICDSKNKILSEDIKQNLQFYEDVAKRKFIDVNKASSIAAKHGIFKISFFKLDYDARWKNPDFYEPDEKKWKITWTLIGTENNKANQKAIKIDAHSGKVLSKYSEIIVD